MWLQPLKHPGSFIYINIKVVHNIKPGKEQYLWYDPIFCKKNK